MPRSVWMLVPGLLTVLACAAGPDPDEPKPVDRPARVEVVNNYPLPVEILAIGSGINQRLGTVHPGMSAHFNIPQNVIGSGGVVLQARPAAESQSFRSDPILIAPGSIVDFRITAQLFSSTATLRP